MNTPRKIILLGPPGSGKDTYALLIAATFGIPTISMGAMLRAEVVKQTENGVTIAGYMARGEMVPPHLVTPLLQARLAQEDCANGYVLNGYTRSMESLANYLAIDTPTHVIHLLLSDDDIRDRLHVRGRDDDKAHIIDARLRRYHEEEVAVGEYWKKDPTVRYAEIWTNREPLPILQEIIDFLRSE